MQKKGDFLKKLVFNLLLVGLLLLFYVCLCFSAAHKLPPATLKMY